MAMAVNEGIAIWAQHELSSIQFNSVEFNSNEDLRKGGKKNATPIFLAQIVEVI